jgi:hypothetical protein
VGRATRQLPATCLPVPGFGRPALQPSRRHGRTRQLGRPASEDLDETGGPPQQSVVSCIWGTDFVALRAVRKDNDRLERLKKEAKASHP